MNTITLDITIAGETRAIEFANSGRMAVSGNVASGKIGMGGKNHAVEITAVLIDEDTNPRVAAGYRNRCVTAADGSVWGIQSTGYALNRQARIVGWFDDASTWNSRHIGSARRA